VRDGAIERRELLQCRNEGKEEEETKENRRMRIGNLMTTNADSMERKSEFPKMLFFLVKTPFPLRNAMRIFFIVIFGKRNFFSSA
jgi:hypothetical protein